MAGNEAIATPAHTWYHSVPSEPATGVTALTQGAIAPAASLMSSELARHSKRNACLEKGYRLCFQLSPSGGRNTARGGDATLREAHQGGEPAPVEWPSPCPHVKEELSQSWEEGSPLSHSKVREVLQWAQAPTRCVSEMLVIKRREGRERSRSRGKQPLLPPSRAALFRGPGTLRPATELTLPGGPSVPASQRGYSQEEGGPFKTPIKETLPISPTSSKSVLPLSPKSWRLTPQAKDTFGPLPDSLGLTDLSTTPLKSCPSLTHPKNSSILPKPLFPLRNGSPQTKLPLGEPQVASLPAYRSLTEGLVLDTMNDSLSRILLDISFPGLEEGLLGPDNITGLGSCLSCGRDLPLPLLLNLTTLLCSL
ncbi:LOW QUALITY PROTEIN: hypothetical protein QTO34_001630, partial [Cnephaeus nilssonii]